MCLNGMGESIGGADGDEEIGCTGDAESVGDCGSAMFFKARELGLTAGFKLVVYKHCGEEN